MDDPELTPCDRHRLLIVDDEKAIRSVFQQLIALGLPHCSIDLAVNGAEAVDEFRWRHHGVILMDLHMPVMDGETAFHEIKKLCEEEGREMPAVVFCTGYDPSERLQKAIINSRSHFLLRKPVTGETLVEVLKPRLDG